MNPFRRWVSRNSENPGSGFHSTSYHRHFEGYTETQVATPDGKRKIVRVYTGLYYTQNLSDKRRMRTRLLFAILYLGAALLFAFCSSFPIMSNRTWYVGILQALSFLGLFWMLYVMIKYMTASRRMEVGRYRATSGPLIKSSRITAVALGLLTLVTTLHTLLLSGEGGLTGLLCAVGFACSAIAIFLIGNMEARITYNRIRSEHETSGNGIEIDR